MSESPSSPPDAIGRREALRRTALLLGGAISAPTLAAMLAGCDASPGSDARAWRPSALTDAQGTLVATIADHIIPATDTPGARDVGVHRFIDRMLAEYYDADARARFLAGLTDVDRRAQALGARPFVELPVSRQHDVLVALDGESYAPTGSPAAPGPTPFFRTMKELTLLGYYTSEAGATRELRYARVPGRFEGCVPFASVGRAWAT